MVVCRDEDGAKMVPQAQGTVSSTLVVYRRLTAIAFYDGVVLVASR